MEMSGAKWGATAEYLREVFGSGGLSTTLAGHAERAEKAGLPPIAITPEVGRLLAVLTRLASRGPGATGLAVEVGTLGGFSGMWIASGLPESGKLITIEADAKHARFARSEIDAAGMTRRVEVREGLGIPELTRLSRELGEMSLDVAFIDAEKTEYSAYAGLLKPMVRVGGLFIADNALGSGSWWITDRAGEVSGPAWKAKDAVDRFNRELASDPEFEAACVPIREGVAVAVRVR